FDDRQELRIGGQRHRFPIGAGDIVHGQERLTISSEDHRPVLDHLFQLGHRQGRLFQWYNFHNSISSPPIRSRSWVFCPIATTTTGSPSRSISEKTRKPRLVTPRVRADYPPTTYGEESADPAGRSIGRRWYRR